MRAGIRFVYSTRLLRTLLIYGGLFNFFWAMTAALVVIFLQEIVGLTSGAIGLFFAVAGLTSVLAVLLVGRLNSLFGEGHTTLYFAAAAGLFGLALPLAHPGALLWLAAAGNALSTLSVAVVNINAVSIRQRICPISMQGKVNATARFIMWGVLPLGALVGGLLAQVCSVRVALWIAGLGAAGAVAALIGSPLGATRETSSLIDIPQ
jgi:MFS family permease